MAYEIKIVVLTNNVEQFKSDCYSIGTQPIVPDTLIYPAHVVSLSNHSFLDSYNRPTNNVLENLIYEFNIMGYTVVSFESKEI